MGSREFKNSLPLRDKSYGIERRENLTKEVLRDSSPFPNPLTYKDIDQEFHRWVDEDLSISFEGNKLPTIDLFSNQRFSEYFQSWENVDDKRNMMLNFKAISRENNPKAGTLNGDSRNIPGERTYLMQRIQARDKNNRPYFIEYRMKQPYTVDLIYKINLVTNKFELLNQFNQMINDKFKAIDCYIRPEGHFLPMKLNDISDESEYNIDDRQFYSQSYSITVMAYIINENDFIVEEKPYMKIGGFDDDEGKGYVEIEELPLQCPENPYYYQPIVLTVSMDDCKEKIKFRLDCDFFVEKIELSEYLSSFKLYVNDTEIEEREDLDLKENDEIKICHLRRRKSGETSIIKFTGYNKRVIFDENEDNKEFNDDTTQFAEDITIE